MNKLYILSLTLATTMLLSSCGGNKEESAAKSDNASVSADTSTGPPIDEQKEFKFLQIIANIPAPSKQVLNISKSGLKYDVSLVNKPENAKKYSTSFKKSINYGVCLSDLAYVASFGNTQDILNQFGSAKVLAEGSSALVTFEKVVSAAHFDEHLKEVDTLEVIIDKIYTATDEFLTNDHHLDIAAKILVGSWIENQYLVLNSIKGIDRNAKNDKLYDQLWEQKLHLANINSLMTEYGQYEEMNDLAKKLAEFEKVFYSGLKESKDMNKAKAAEMLKAINELRANIIS